MTSSTTAVPDRPAAAAPDASGVALRDFSMLLALLAVWGFFYAMNPAFLGARNLSNLAVELSITAVLSLGMLLIILTGQIDLSIGSGVGLFGGVAAVLVFHHGWPAGGALAVAAAAAVAVWLAMGALIVRQKVPAFIITLAGLLIKGLHWLVIGSATVPVQVGGQPNALSVLTTWFLPAWAGLALAAAVWLAIVVGTLRGRQRRAAFDLSVEPGDVTFARLLIAGQLLLLFVLVCNQYRGVPLSAVLLGVVAAAVWVVTRHTRLGRYCYAVGGNEEAALLAGVPVGKVVIAAFGVMGLLTALGGFMQTAYAGASTTTIGQLLELDAIAACVIGGASLKGGRGTVLGVLFGSLIMASLINGMTLLAVTPETKLIARGAVLALAVWLDVRLARPPA